MPGETGTSVRFGTGRGGSTRTVVAPCLEIPLPTVVHAARAAHRRGWTVVLNPAPAPAPAPDGALPAELLEAVDLIVPNEHEAAALGIAPGDRSDARDAPTVLITRGARGATLFIDGSQHEVAAPSVRPVDTTGAGDAFIGVLTASLAHGDDLLDAARRAVVGGAIATLGEGARGALPTASAIDRLL